VGAFDVIGSDLEFGDGINPCFTGKQQISVKLAGIGQLGGFGDKDFAAKNGMGVIIEDTFMQLIDDSVRILETDFGVGVGGLSFCDRSQPM
jgi:hypothetical protein